MTGENAPGLRRRILTAQQNSPALGPLAQLPGHWVGKGRGWNMIALPVDAAHSGGVSGKFRILFNQFDESLSFTHELNDVPNRGAPNDQKIVGLQYIQNVTQVAAIDSMGSQISPLKAGEGIHREPGFFLNLTNEVTISANTPPMNGLPLNVARVGSIPHGDTITTLGVSIDVTNAPISLAPATIGDFSALPIGAGPRDLSNPYLAPYKQFHDTPFKGDVPSSGFPGFDPTDPLSLLTFPAAETFSKMTVLLMDTTVQGGIENLPFIVKNANATEMRFVLWVEELPGHTPDQPKLQLQYAQRVILEFFDSPEFPGRKIQWPHITINTLQLVP
ncbi:hypothetical protein FBZ87_101372 [Nitrospirillum amazonense]|uniref:Uncharacterized protein n=2 Tax=Nitrospirillum amazonense TaxID=28077 RepID=A0A560KHA1_9PROT|nr:heme-binding protein [Nitrospirillum amazonense]MDG3443194.1 heme-binding protein [Nitrospirillum amazonense]TWB82663.1 hypothetical protein FBZ87_101372 [Nitrospirillum amazonense]